MSSLDGAAGDESLLVALTSVETAIGIYVTSLVPSSEPATRQSYTARVAVQAGYRLDVAAREYCW